MICLRELGARQIGTYKTDIQSFGLNWQQGVDRSRNAGVAFLHVGDDDFWIHFLWLAQSLSNHPDRQVSLEMRLS